jgi:ectoine hydroxylase-related dioxygenase (phytanoyl-CoA dioxygenase family)
LDAGFAIYPSAMSAAECGALLVAISASRNPPARAGTRHLMSNAAVAAAACDSRLMSIAAQFVGHAAVPFSATLFVKTEQANWLIAWHQDTALPMAAPFESTGWGPWSKKSGIHFSHAPAWALSRIIALRLHLDDSTERNGPLRVLPGSQKGGVLTDPEVLAMAASAQPVECLVGRGGVLAMRPLLIHASSKSVNEQPRRVLHILYADALELAPGIRLAVA